MTKVCFVGGEVWGRKEFEKFEFEMPLRHAGDTVLIGYMVGSGQEFQREAQSLEYRVHD